MMRARNYNRPAISWFCLLVIGFLMSEASFSQTRSNKNNTAKRLMYQERVEGSYVEPSRLPRVTSPAYRFSRNSFVGVQVNVSDSGRNIVGDAANEPSIAIDPTNPQRMAIGWRQFNTITNSFRQAGYGYTTNGGLTWKFPGVIQPGVFRSDPVLGSDAEGKFFYNSLTSNAGGFSCNVYPSTTGGASWGVGTSAQGGDKQWMVIDTTRSIGRHHMYSNWTSAYTACDSGQFTRSKNRNVSYDSCVTIPGDPFWGTLAVGPQGELYVVGAGDTAFVLVRSTTARDATRRVTWDTVSVVSLDGEIIAFEPRGPNPSGLLGQTWVCVDNSTAATRGNIYVLCSVARNSNTDPLDVMFARSTNGGRTWSAPLRINDDSSRTAWQWFGTMSVAPNGRIDAVWLDTRNDPGTVLSSLYYSYSMNGGATWSRNERLSGAFNPHVGWPQQNKMGDYFHMVSDNAAAHLAWAATFNNEQDVYYGRISVPTSAVDVTSAPNSFELVHNFPNPFNPTTNIRFTAGSSGASTSLVSLKVFDVLGREVATLVNDVVAPGLNTVSFDASNLATGVYYYRIQAGDYSATKKMMLIR